MRQHDGASPYFRREVTEFLTNIMREGGQEVTGRRPDLKLLDFFTMACMACECIMLVNQKHIISTADQKCECRWYQKPRDSTQRHRDWRHPGGNREHVLQQPSNLNDSNDDDDDVRSLQ